MVLRFRGALFFFFVNLVKPTYYIPWTNCYFWSTGVTNSGPSREGNSPPGCCAWTWYFRCRSVEVRRNDPARDLGQVLLLGTARCWRCSFWAWERIFWENTRQESISLKMIFLFNQVGYVSFSFEQCSINALCLWFLWVSGIQEGKTTTGRNHLLH